MELFQCALLAELLRGEYAGGHEFKSRSGDQLP